MQTATKEEAAKYAKFDFDDEAVEPPSVSAEIAGEETPATPIQQTELEPVPIALPDYEEHVDIEVGKRPLWARPGVKMLLALGGMFAIASFGGAILSNSVSGAGDVTGKGKGTKLDVPVAGGSSLVPIDPRDKTIGELQTNAASNALSRNFDEMKKKEADRAKADANRAKKTGTVVAASVPPIIPAASNPEPYTYRPSSSYTPSYTPSAPAAPYTPRASSSPSAIATPAPKPKILAFGALPEEGGKSPQATPYSGGNGQEYQTVAYNPDKAPVLDTALQDAQQAFLNGSKQVQLQIESKASGRISSGSILPNGFIVTTDSALGPIPAGTRILMKPQTVYPDGKIEAYAVALVTTSGGYQRSQPIPPGAIQFLAENGKIPKAKRPGRSFFDSGFGRMLIGGGAALANQFLSQGQTQTQGQYGITTSTQGGNKDIASLGLSFAKGAIDPLLQSAQANSTTGDKNSFVLEPSDHPYQIKVMQPFTLSL